MASMLEMIWLPSLVCAFFLFVTLIYVLSTRQEVATFSNLT